MEEIYGFSMCKYNSSTTGNRDSMALIRYMRTHEANLDRIGHGERDWGVDDEFFFWLPVRAVAEDLC